MNCCVNLILFIKSEFSSQYSSFVMYKTLNCDFFIFPCLKNCISGYVIDYLLKYLLIALSLINYLTQPIRLVS